MEFLTTLAQTYTTYESSSEISGGAAAVTIIFSILILGGIIVFSIGGLFFWIISLIHIISHEDVKDRVIWLVVILVLGGLGGVVYYFAVKRPYDKGGARAVPPAAPQAPAGS